MSDFAKYKRAARGDIAYNTMRMWQGAIGVTPVDGLASPAYVVARPFKEVEARYFVRLFRTDAYLGEIDACSRGIVKDRNRLYWDQFKQIATPCPPSLEQAAIVQFLDWATGRLDRAIRAKQEVIALLDEQKQAIIQHAVTHGLDPSVPLKPSGIPWLGDIPQHWEVRRAKLVLRETDSRSSTGAESLLRVSQYTGVTPRASEDSTGMPRARSLVGYKLVSEGDLVVNIMIAWNGSLGTSRYAGLVSPAYCVYRISARQNSWYFHHLLRSKLYGARIKQASTGVIESRLRLYSDALGCIEMLIPPYNEQCKIVDRIESESSGLIYAVSRLEREVELLREYRTRLVADVVTGKLDVREAAALLPDEDCAADRVHEEAEPGDDVNALDDDLDLVPEEAEA